MALVLQLKVPGEVGSTGSTTPTRSPPDKAGFLTPNSTKGSSPRSSAFSGKDAPSPRGSALVPRKDAASPRGSGVGVTKEPLGKDAPVRKRKNAICVPNTEDGGSQTGGILNPIVIGTESTPTTPRSGDPDAKRNAFCVPGQDTVSAPPSQPLRPSKTPLRIAAEVQQVLLNLDEVCGRSADWKPQARCSRPFLTYFQQAVSRVLKSLRYQVAQDKAQRGIYEWVNNDSEDQIPQKLKPAHDEESVMHKTTQSSQFWSQMRAAATHGVKEIKGTNTKWADKRPVFSRCHSQALQAISTKSDAWDEAFDQLVDGPEPVRMLWDEISDEAKQFTTPAALREDPRATAPRLPELLGDDSPFVARMDALREHAVKKRLKELRKSRAPRRTQAGQQRPGTPDVQDLCQQVMEWRSHMRKEQAERPEDGTPRSNSSRHQSLASQSRADEVRTPMSMNSSQLPIVSDEGAITPRCGRKSAVGSVDTPRSRRKSMAAHNSRSPSMVSSPDNKTDRPVGHSSEWRPAALGEWLLSPEVTEYLEAHTGICTVPSKHVFLVTGDMSSVNLSGQRLTDERLGALVTPVASRSTLLTSINLSCNCVKDGLETLIKGLLPPPPPWAREESGNKMQLDSLDVSQNPLSIKSIRALAEVFRTKRLFITRLDLSSISIPQEGFQAICAAIFKSQSVKALSFADTQCGRHRQDMCQCAARLCFAVTELDLSQNYFREEGLNYVGQALSSKAALCRKLSLADNAGCSDMRETKPMHLFCEALGENKSLCSLDLSGCYLEQRSTICLEDALQVHPLLEELNVSRNPLGQAGLRAVLRMVADGNTRLRRVQASELRNSTADPSVTYNPADINEEYRNGQELKLWRPYHRCILRLLVSRAERFGVSNALKEFTLDGHRTSAKFPRGQHTRRLKVPTDGVAEFHFFLKASFEELATGSAAMVSSHRRRRIPTSFLKFVALVKLWRQQKDEDDRRNFLFAASRDLSFTPAQVKFFIRETEANCPELLADVSMYLFTTLELPEWSLMISALRPPHFIATGRRDFLKRARMSALRGVSSLVRINFNGFTGHHHFSLCHPTDYSAAERIFAAIRWEAATAAKQNMLDTTEAGSHIGIRNFSFRDTDNEASTKAVTHYRIDWVLPGDGFTATGELCFDYVTPIRPDRRKTQLTVLSQAQVSLIAAVLRGDGGSDVYKGARFQALQQVVHKFWINTGHLRELLAAAATMDAETEPDAFHPPLGPAFECTCASWVQDLYVMLFPRCVDFGTTMNDIVRGILHDEAYFGSQDHQEVQKRLGMPNTFDALNVHREGHNLFTFDLSKRDHRICLSFLMRLSLREEGENFKDCHYTGLSEHCDTGYWTIPSTWFTEIPHEGIVTLTYARSDGHGGIQMRTRRDLAREILGWVVDKSGTPFSSLRPDS